MSEPSRGQVTTLESLTAAVILLSMIAFALQATVITPLTASTANQQIEEQNRALSNDLLETGTESGELTELLRHYNTTRNRYVNTTDGTPFYTSGHPPTEYGNALSAVLTEDNIAFNVYAQYRTENGTEQRIVVYQGEPSDNAATATKTVFLYDHMNVTDPNNDDVTLGEVDDDPDENFYMPDVDDGPLYNVVRIEITSWKM